MEGDSHVVVADSGSDVQAAPSEAVESSDLTHGDTTEQAATPADAAATVDTPDDEADDPEIEPSDDDSEEEAKSKAEKRRERRRQNEENRIAKAVQERLDRIESDRAEKSAADKRESDARAAEETFWKRFGDRFGSPEQRTALDAEISALGEEVANMRPYAEGTDLDVLEAKQAAYAEKRAKRIEWDTNWADYQENDRFQTEVAKRQIAEAGVSLPEEFQKKFWNSMSLPEAMSIHEAGVVAREAAKAKAEVARITAEYESKLAAEVAAHAATRNGAPGAGPAPNGANGSGSAGGSVIARLKREAGSPEEFAARAARGDYAHVNLSG